MPYCTDSYCSDSNCVLSNINRDYIKEIKQKFKKKQSSMKKIKRSGLEQYRINFVRSSLRRASIRWKPKNSARVAARIEQRLNPKTGRMKWVSKCANCASETWEDKMEMDHIDPVVPLNAKDINWDRYIKNLLCAEEGYQALCFLCHEKKTAKEQKERLKKKRKK